MARADKKHQGCANGFGASAAKDGLLHAVHLGRNEVDPADTSTGHLSCPVAAGNGIPCSELWILPSSGYFSRYHVHLIVTDMFFNLLRQSVGFWAALRGIASSVRALLCHFLPSTERVAAQRDRLVTSEATQRVKA